MRVLSPPVVHFRVFGDLFPKSQVPSISKGLEKGSISEMGLLKAILRGGLLVSVVYFFDDGLCVDAVTLAKEVLASDEAVQRLLHMQEIHTDSRRTVAGEKLSDSAGTEMFLNGDDVPVSPQGLQ